MKPLKSEISDLVGEAPSIQHQEWWAYRIGWTLMALILLAGLLGVWGQGVVSRAEVTSPDGRLEVSYERFVRNQAATTLEIRFPPRVAEQGTIHLFINQNYLTAHDVDAITPDPESVTVQGKDFVYEFQVHKDSPLTVSLDLHTDVDSGMGRLEAVFRGGSTGEVHFGQIVYP